MQGITTNHYVTTDSMMYQAGMGISDSSDSSDVSMSDVSDDGHDESLEDERGPSDEEDDRVSVDEDDGMSIDEEDEVSEDEDDETSDDEDDGDSEDEDDQVSDDEDDRLPHEKCGLSDYELVTLSRDDNFGLLEKSAELQDEEADAILDEEAAEAAWPTCCPYLTDVKTKLGRIQDLLIAEHSAQYHSPTGHATQAEIDAFRAAKCLEVRAKYCRLIFQHMRRPPKQRRPLPIEIREIIYGHIFEWSGFDLHRRVGTYPPNSDSYSHLIQFKIFTADAAVRQELAEAWYKATTFYTSDPWTLASSLYQIGWSAGLKPADSLQNDLWPFDLIRNLVVTIPVQHYRDTAKETLVLGKLRCLSLLKKITTITLALEGPGEFIKFPYYYQNDSDAEDYAQSIWYLYPEVIRLREEGFELTVRPHWSRTPVFGLDETTVEEMTETVQQAIEDTCTF